MDLTTLSALPDGAGSDTVGGSTSKDNTPAKASAGRVKQNKTEALNDINTFYDRTRQERRPHEIIWGKNAAMARGQQTGKWNQVTAKLEAQHTPSHRVRRAINLILPKVKAKLAKYVKSRPLPQVIAASTNREAMMNAKVTEKALRYLWRKLGLEPKYEDAILWAMITGKSYWWFHWNPSALGQVREPDGPGGPGQILDVPLGDIMVEQGTAFEFLPGDVGIARLQDQHKIMRVKVRDVADVEARWDLPKGTIVAESTAGDLFQVAKQIAQIGARNVTGYSTDDDRQNKDAPTKVVVKELFTRPCAEYPKGRYQVAAGTQLLKDDDELPYDFGQDVANPFPVVEFADMITPGQYWPSTMVEQLTGVQIEYNNTRNRAEEQLKMQAHPKLMVPKQANLAPNAYNSEAGEKIEYHFIPAMPPPGFLSAPNISGDTWRILQLIREEFDSISNIRPADVGNVSGGGESGFQTNLLQEASDSVHAPDIRRNELAIEEASFKMRRLMAMGYTVPRLIAIVGKNHAPDVFEFSQDNIDEHADVIVQVGSALPTLKAARAKMIMEMHQAMLFGDPNDATVKRKVLGMLEVGGTEDAIDIIRRDEDMARQENLEVSKGHPIDPPMPWENHQVQYGEHTDQLKAPEIAGWSQPQRDELIRHVILHARFINPTNALMLAQQFGFTDLIDIISPMLPPAGPPGPPPPTIAPPAAPPPGGPPGLPPGVAPPLGMPPGGLPPGLAPGVPPMGGAPVGPGLGMPPGLPMGLPPGMPLGGPPPMGGIPPIGHPLGDIPPAVPEGMLPGLPPEPPVEPPNPVIESASRILQKEILALQRASIEFNGNPEGFTSWVQQFFDTLAPVIAQTLSIDPAEAQLYCDTQRDDVLVHGLHVITTWTPDYLAGLALKASQQDPLQSALMAMVRKPAPDINVTVTNPPPKPMSKHITFEKKDGVSVGATIEEQP